MSGTLYTSGSTYKKTDTRRLRILSDKMPDIIVEKREACLKYMKTENDIDKIEYNNRKRLRLKKETTRINTENWDRLVTNTRYTGQSTTGVHNYGTSEYKPQRQCYNKFIVERVVQILYRYFLRL
jgi:hypothetical protein